MDLLQALRRRMARRDQRRRGIRSNVRGESLERRQLMASDLAAVTGRVFIDADNNGAFDAGTDIVVAQNAGGDLVAPGTAGAQGVDVQLFRDGGNNTFEGTGAGTDDTNVGTVTTDPNTGLYRFEGQALNLVAGTYFVQQVDTFAELDEPSVQTVIITEADGEQISSIDEFLDNPAVTFTATGPGATQTSTQDNVAGVIGGDRDVTLTVTSADTNDNLTVVVGGGTISVNAGGGGTGEALVQYDGDDDSTNRDFTGLANADLIGDQTELSAGLILEADAQLAGDNVLIQLFTDASNFASVTVPIPQDNGGGPQEIFVPYDDFVVTGAGFDFADIGLIETTVDIEQPDNDVEVSIIEARGSDVFTADLANIQPVALGGTLFIDVSETGINDGVQQATESNFTDPVTVELFDVTGLVGTFDPTVLTPIDTTTTTAGNYLFTDLDPGDYRVVIPAGQFVDNTGNANPNGPLFGYTTSTGNDPTPDPDDNVNFDDNGFFLAGGSLVTEAITLVSQAEPTDDDVDDDADDENGNTTVDFGLLPQVDLQITKSVVAADSVIAPGGTVVFDITVQNNGPLDATAVEVSDVLPAGLTFNELRNTPLTRTGTGQNVNVTVGNLAADASLTFQIVADVAANQTADVDNTATVATDEQFETDAANNTSTVSVDFRETDLRIVKDASPEPVTAGEQLTYTITVTNDGPDDAEGVFVDDVLPDEVTFVSGTVTLPGQTGDNSNLILQNPNNNGNDRELRISIGDLDNGDSAVITIVTDVDVDSDDLFSNAATVNLTPDTDTNTANDTDSADSNVARSVDLAITKSAVGTAMAGDGMQFSITVVNNGPSTARGVTVTDQLPDGVVFDGNLQTTDGVTVAQDGGDDNDGDDLDNLTFTLPDIAPGAAGAVTFTFDVDLDSDLTGAITNTAVVATTDTDTVAGNNGDDAVFTPAVSFDLTIDKSVDQATATPGDDTLVYTIVVTNSAASASDAPNVRVSDTLPAGLTGISADAPGAINNTVTFNNGTIDVDYTSIPVGETRTITVNASVNASATGTIDNTATVVSTTDAAGETNADNNDDNAVTTLTPDFDIVVDKSTTATNVGPGDTVTYSVTLTNEGPSDAADIILSDDVPAGLTFVSGTLSGSAATLSGSTVSFPAIDLGDTDTATATLTFTVDGTAPAGTITNTASIPTTLAGENDTTNNADTAAITVVPTADVTVAKSVDQSNAQIGDRLTYTITATNNGPSAADAVTIVDTLPAGVTFVSGTGPGGVALTAAGQTVTFNGGTLASGGSFTATILADIAAGTTGTVTNGVTVTTMTSETDTTNNAAAAATVVDPLTGSIAGSVYVDANNNGVRDAGENGIAGVTVQLTGNDTDGNPVSATTTTDANGDYLFAGLAAGTYRVDEVQPAGFVDGQESVGTGATGATANDDFFATIGLDPGDDAVNFDFGELAPPISKRRFMSSST